MKKVIFLVLILMTTNLFAQADSADFGKWIPKGVAGVNVSQIAFSNWTQGGENSITWTSYGNFGLSFETMNWNFTNELKLAFGRSKLGDQEFRTNNNEFFLETVLAYKYGWAVDPYVSNSIRTVLAKGYDYEQDPKVEISKFFDPGYITQSVGFTYEKLKNIKTRLGIGFQETITDEHPRYSDDPETSKIENFKFETGIESVTEANVSLQDNLLYTSKLRLFGRFEDLNVWDVRWDNTITAKINNYVNVNLNVLLIYDKTQSVKTQLKEALQLGITYTLF
jgi:hypothetical protein